MSLTESYRDTAEGDIIKLSQSNVIDCMYDGISFPNNLNRLDEYLDREEDLDIEKNILLKQLIAG